MSILIHVADRVLNRPLLITRDKAQVILSVLSGRIGVNSPEASRFEGTPLVRDADGNVRAKPFNVSDGVGIITVTGSLVNRGAWVGARSGLTSYEGFGFQVNSARKDPAVRSVILDLHTPGGEATGAFEAADLVRQLAAEKPTIAVVNGMAASAGYAIASAANEIVTTRTGVSGSIGVVMLHADYSKWLANEGIDPTFIFAGDHKVDGNPFEPLPDSVKADLQAEVTAFYEQFLETVALGRGSRMGVDQARATQARTYIGAEAVKVGLADRVGSFESVLAELQSKSPRAAVPGRTTSMKGKSMDTTTGAPAADAGTITQAEMDTAVAAAEQKGAAAAQQRLASILSADGIKGDAARMTAALDLAVRASAMSADDVTAFVTSNVKAASSDGRSAADVLAKMDKAAEGVESRPSATGDAGPVAPQAATTPEGWTAEWEASAELQSEYPTAAAYVATKKREAQRAA